MRLLKANADGSFSWTWFNPEHIPRYAILSHRWETGEVTFQDLTTGVASSKAGYRKIQFCGQQAQNDDLEYFWVDSCCIDKSSSAELSTAINSMFRWYHDSAKCYVYLSDVSTGEHSWPSEIPWEIAFRQSKWFTRGWTLQELLAPRWVKFFSRDGKALGDKNSLAQQVHEVTGIPVKALQGSSLSHFSIDERMSWAARRATTVEEDQAYCLMGIFGIFLPIIYGEGREHARKRLKEEINKVSEELKCLQALRTSDYEQFKDGRNPNRLEGTCKWFLQHSSFHEWQQSISGLLWVTADPGCGKSVLAKSLIDYELKSTESRTTCHFFFKDEGDVQKNSTIALSSLLHQLFSQKQLLIQHAMEDYKTEGNHLPHSFHKLWAILTRATSDPKAGEVICILDALDECAEVERYQLISVLSTFYKQSQCSSQLKFLITSRPYYDIERKFAGLIQHFPTVRLHGEKELEAISCEIDIVIQSKVSELGQELGLDDSERSIIQDELLAMEHRTYLWLKLIIEVIRDEIDPTKERLKSIINTLPATVDEAYEAILSKSKDQAKARKLLHIIVAAKRPLTLKEMSIALAIEDHHQSYEDLSLHVGNEARIATTIRNLCGLFANIIDQKVFLIHQTAKEFLVAKVQASSGSWKHVLRPRESELLMARICITYLMFRSFEDDHIDEPAYVKDFTDQHGLLEYAAMFWSSHYRKAQTEMSDTTNQLVISLCNTESRRYMLWFAIYCDLFDYDECPPRPSDTIAVASYFGHKSIVKLLLDSKINIDSKDSDGGTPLLSAAGNGHKGVVQLLLEAGADVNAKDNYDVTPLWRAVENGYKDIVKLLLDAKPYVDAKNSEGRTPLWQAAEDGYEDIVKLLLEAKADVGMDDDQGQTLLSWAAENEYEDIVELLLEVQAEVNVEDYCGQTPLSWAARNGNENIVKLLLKAMAEVEIEEYLNKTPLSWVSRNGHKGIVKPPLFWDPDAKVNFGRTALSWAAGNGAEILVRLLLEAKADVEATDYYDRTPLSWAARQGQDTAVKLLLDAKADIEAKDYYGLTPLSWAARKGQDTTVKLLLDAKADVESKDNEHRTPLSWAAGNRHEGTVKLLLEAKADVESKDYDDRTPLSWAAENGSEIVVRLLLEANANAESKDDSERTPLSWAAKEAHGAVVQLLLGAKANIESKDSMGWTPLSLATDCGRESTVVEDDEDDEDRTPLSWAARQGQGTAVKLLLEAKADIESRDYINRTPLSWAAQNGNKKVVKLLLDAKADVESKDDRGRTPLSWLADCEGGQRREARWCLSRYTKMKYDAIVKLLLEAKADVESKDKDDWTPLWWAVANGNDTIFELLLEAKANVDAEDNYGRTPLWRAAAKGHEGTVKLLLDAKADIDAKDKSDRTPLWGAAAKGNDTIVKLLLEAKANVDAEDKYSRTPLWIAAAKGHEGTVKLLLDAKANVDVEDKYGRTPL